MTQGGDQRAQFEYLRADARSNASIEESVCPFGTLCNMSCNGLTQYDASFSGSTGAGQPWMRSRIWEHQM